MMMMPLGDCAVKTIADASRSEDREENSVVGRYGASTGQRCSSSAPKQRTRAARGSKPPDSAPLHSQVFWLVGRLQAIADANVQLLRALELPMTHLQRRAGPTRNLPIPWTGYYDPLTESGVVYGSQ